MMAKAKRMSDMFASSAETDANATITSATPPYSSEGPTLPLIDGEAANAAGQAPNGPEKTTVKSNGHATKRKTVDVQTQEGPAGQHLQPIATVHPALYEPWTLLPREILGLLLSQARLADTQNVVPVVFTRNQNIKSGIFKLTGYLRSLPNAKASLELPEALKKKKSIIAVSAQGEGTAKLVSIVDMAKRTVGPSTAHTGDDKKVETWWMYTSLASVEVEQKSRTVLEGKASTDGGEATQETEEEEAFEPMDVDVPDQKNGQEAKKIRKIPVLTVWMTKARIAAFKEAFGEQTFMVETLLQER